MAPRSDTPTDPTADAAAVRALFGLDGAVALVTGAARGIGLEIAATFAALGARVALADRDDPAGWADAARARLGGADASMLRADVTATDDCRRAVDDVVGRYGGLDVLVNNAGINASRPAVGIDDAEWRRVLGTNLDGTFRMCREAHRALVRSDRACVVNLSSGVGLYAVRDNAHYATSKAAIDHLTRLLALEWAPQRIRVNAVAPTVVPTAMSAPFVADPAYVAAKLASTPLGRFARAGEVAAAVAFLAMPAASMITGQVLRVDGGCSIA